MKQSVSNLTALLFTMGYQGGTIQQAAQDLGVKPEIINHAGEAQMGELLRMAQEFRVRRDMAAEEVVIVPAKMSRAMKSRAIAAKHLLEHGENAEKFWASVLGGRPIAFQRNDGKVLPCDGYMLVSDEHVLKMLSKTKEVIDSYRLFLEVMYDKNSETVEAVADQLTSQLLGLHRLIELSNVMKEPE